jgi:hypothetical protein
MKGRKLFFLFVDGVGIGAPGNPVEELFTPFLDGNTFCTKIVPFEGKEALILPLDACLGLEGLPQSATGQTTIMTGINASAKLGYHLIAFPNQELLPLIREHSLMKRLHEAGIPATAANLYSHSFFQERKNRHRNMFPVSSLSIEAAGIPFRFIEDYQRGEAVFADITNEMLIERGYQVEKISPREAASRILRIFEKNDFVFFEYFLTDTYGHAHDEEKIRSVVSVLNDFLQGIWEGSAGELDILVTSDHGNAEDNSIGDHTRNPVPFFLLSRKLGSLKPLWKNCRSLLDISPFITNYFGAS